MINSLRGGLRAPPQVLMFCIVSFLVGGLVGLVTACDNYEGGYSEVAAAGGNTEYLKLTLVYYPDQNSLTENLSEAKICDGDMCEKVRFEKREDGMYSVQVRVAKEVNFPYRFESTNALGETVVISHPIFSTPSCENCVVEGLEFAPDKLNISRLLPETCN